MDSDESLHFSLDEKLLQRGLISSIEASARFDITNDYVSLLCRQKKVRGFLLGRSWFVEEQSLREFLIAMRDARDAQRRALSERLRNEYNARTQPAEHEKKSDSQETIKTLRHLFLGILMLACVTSVFAPTGLIAASAPPQIISYEGRLADASGNLLGGSGSTYYFKFSIWDNATVGNGTQLWPLSAPSATTATVKQGVFEVNIGDTANGYQDALNFDFSSNPNIYLQVEVSSDGVTYETLSPRQQITSSAYAALAGAVVGTTTPSAFGTTTPAANSFVTISATSTSGIPLTLEALPGQTSNLMQILSGTGSQLLTFAPTGLLTTNAASTTNLSAINLWVIGQSDGCAQFTNGKLISTNTSCAGGGGGGSGFTFIRGGIYNSTSTDQVLIGENASTTLARFEVNGLSAFKSGFLAFSSSTITSGLFSANGGASTTNLTASGIGFFGTASTTNLTVGTPNAILTTNANGVVTGTSTVAVNYGGTGSTTLTGILVGNGTGALKSLVVGSNLSFDGSTLSVGSTNIWPFITTDTNFNVAVQSTTTPEWFKNGFFASSTSQLVNASTSQLTISSAAWLPLNSSLLATDATGKLVATSSVGVNYLSGILGISNGGTANSSYTTGQLLSYNGTQFVSTSTIGNNQLANSSITINGSSIALGGSVSINSAWPWNILTTFSTSTNATTTASWFKYGLYASSTSQFDQSSTTIASVGTFYLNGSGFTSLTGSGLSNSGGSLTVSGLTTSNFSSANVSQFTNDSRYIASSSLSASYPLAYNSTTGAFTFSGLATTSTWTNGNLAYVTGGNTLASVATTTASCSGSASCSPFTVIGSSPATIAGTGFNWPWTLATTFSTSTNATSTGEWFQFGLYASSTSQFTSANIWNVLTLKATTSTLLATDANGNVIATSTIGNNQLQNSSVTINTGNGVTGGGSVALGGSITVSGTGWPWTSLTNWGTTTQATTTAFTAPAFFASSTLASQFPYASTTALSAGVLCLTGDTCRTTWPTATGGGAWPWSVATTFGTSTNATSTGEWFQFGLYASSTSQFANATTTNLTASGNTWFPTLATPAGTFLAVDPNGKLIATTTSAGGVTAVNGTYPIQSTGGTTPTISLAFGTTTANSWSALQTISAASTTNLTATNFWQIGQSAGCAQYDSNGKLTSTGTNCAGAGGVWPWSLATTFSTSTNATSTGEWFQFGLYASSTSQFTNENIWGTLALKGVTTAQLLATDASGNVTATSSIGNNQLQNSTISGVSLGGTLANLTAGTGLSGSAYNGSGAQSFSLNTANGNTWTALQVFSANATASQFTATSSVWFTGVTASSLLALDQNNKLVATSTIGNNQLQNSSVTINTGNGVTGGGSVALGGSITVSGTGWPWTSLTNWGTTTQATTTAFTAPAFFASSTLASQFSNATSSQLTISSAAWLPLNSSLLATDATGKLVATSSVGVNYLSGILGISNGGTANSSYTTGQLLSYNGTQFVSTSTIGNNQLANSSITINGSSIALGGSVTVDNFGWPWSRVTNFGTTTQATTSPILATAFFASSTSQASQFNNTTSTNATVSGTFYLNNSGFTSLTGSGLSNSGGSLTVAGLTTSNFSSTNVSQWTNDIHYVASSSLSASFPLAYDSSTGAFTFSGLATTSTWTAGNLAYVVNGNTLASVATGTVSAGSSAITVTAGRAAIGGALSIDCATASGSQAGCLSSADWTTFNSKDGFGWPWSRVTNFGTTTQATTSPILATAFFASSTSQASQFNNTTSTNATVSGNTWLTGLTGGTLLSLDGNKMVISSSTIGNNQLQNSSVTINTGNGVTGGGSVALGGSITVSGTGWPWTSLTNWGTTTQATTTAFTAPAFFASSTLASQFSNATSSQLTISSAAWLPLNSSLLATDATGKLVATSSVGVNYLSGILGISNGGTANSSYTTGQLLSYNGTQFVSTSTIGNNQLQNSTISSVALGGTLGALTAFDSSLTFSGSYTGAAAQTVRINTGNGNTWTALQQFTAGASTTILSASNGLSTTTIFGNATSTFGAGIQTSYLNVTGTSATSTFANGIVLSGGCVYVNGACLGGSGGGAGTVNSGTAGQFAYYVSNGTAVSGTSTLFVASNQKVGIGTTTPSASLEIADSSAATTTALFISNFGNATSSTYTRLGFRALDSTGTGTTTATIGSILEQNFNGAKGNLTFLTLQSGQLTEGARLTSIGNFGVGTTSPYRRLSVTDSGSSNPQIALSASAGATTQLFTNSSGQLLMTSSAGNIFLTNDNLSVCSGGSAISNTCLTAPTGGSGDLIVQNKSGFGTSTSLTAVVNIDNSDAFNTGANFLQIASTSANSVFLVNANGNVGIGTSTPTQQLSVQQKLYVAAGNPSTLGTATSTFQGDVLITGKLDVSTIDPVYTIDGTKYATYGASTVGVHEEVESKVTPSEWNADKKMYEYTIDFSNLEKGSDLWLFYQVTDFGADWQNLITEITPAFDGRVYYEEDRTHNQLHIFASQNAPVSARLSAYRFDFTHWGNERPDQGTGFGGYTLSSK